MAPASVDLPAPSALSQLLTNLSSTAHPAHLDQLATTIRYNLQYEHEWTSLSIYTHSPVTGALLPRPVVAGRPPKRIYVHPDEQIALLKVEHDTGRAVTPAPELEWVLPSHIGETWSLAKFAAVFDALSVMPDGAADTATDEDVGGEWRGTNRQKRILLATLHDDSTVVYYIMHDGIVKPRQN